MNTLKTLVNELSPIEFIESVVGPKRKSDAIELLNLFSNITGMKPKMWGASIVGYGTYHYKSDRSRQEGDWPLVAFSPRKQALSLYVMSGLETNVKLLPKLGKHKVGKGCLYINKLEDVDQQILTQIIKNAFDEMKRQYPDYRN